jgi:hypothetical protein
MKLEISDEYAMDLVYLCKRVTFYDAINRANGETHEKREAMAYRILRVLEEIEESLSKAGYSVLSCCDCNKPLIADEAYFDEENNAYCLVCAETYENITGKETVQKQEGAK